MQPELVSVLLVEDDDVAAEGVLRGMRKHKIANPVVVVEDGAEALEVLRGEHARSRITRPYIVLLDLNMPRMNGFEPLAALRADPALEDTVVFVLTTSNSDEDKRRAYRSQIAGYMVKSEVGPGFRKAIGLLGHYWAAVSLPA